MKNLPLLLLLFLACQSPDKQEYDLVITNVNLIDGSGSELQSNQNIYIRRDRIVKIDTQEVTSNENIIDGTGKYLMPGLFDAHAHTSDYEYAFPRFMNFGVTSILVPGGSTCSNDYFAQMRNIGEIDSLPAPRVFHTSQHFISEGSHPVRTYTSSNWVEGETVFYLRDTAQISRLVKEVTQYPIKGIKLTIEDGPMPPPVPRISQEFVNKVVIEAQKQGTKVFVHVSDNIELAMALEAGINNFLHYTGVDLDFERDRDMVSTIYQSNISWVSTLMLDKSFMYPLHPEWLEQYDIKNIYAKDIETITDPNEIKRAEEYLRFFEMDYGLDNPTLESIVAFQVEDINTLYQNGVNMVLGTDTGNDYVLPGYSLHEEMQMMQLGGMKPIDIIKMGTHNAAKMLDVLDDLGTIENGKIADMILLDKNPLADISNTLAINRVIKNGVLQKRISK